MMSWDAHSDVEEGEEGRKGEALTEKSTARSDKGEAHDTRPGRRRHVCGRAESGHQQDCLPGNRDSPDSPDRQGHQQSRLSLPD